MYVEFGWIWIFFSYFYIFSPGSSWICNDLHGVACRFEDRRSLDYYACFEQGLPKTFQKCFWSALLKDSEEFSRILKIYIELYRYIFNFIWFRFLNCVETLSLEICFIRRNCRRLKYFGTLGTGSFSGSCLSLRAVCCHDPTSAACPDLSPGVSGEPCGKVPPIDCRWYNLHHLWVWAPLTEKL